MQSIEGLSLKQIQYFISVAENRSFRQAAIRLGITQPTLSNQIAQLEKTLEIQLFERTRKGINLTPQGREMQSSARRVIEEAEGFSTQAGLIAGGGIGTFRLGVPPTLGPYLLPHILPPIHEHYADLKLYVREEAPSDLEVALINGNYDLILSTQPFMSKELTVTPLFKEPLKVGIPRDHPLADKKRINRTDLFGQSVLTISEHHLFHRQIAELCESVGAVVKREFEGTSLDSVRQMVVMGMGIAFLPALYVQSEIQSSEELRIADVEGIKVVREHALVWRSTSPVRNFYRDFAKEIRTIVKGKLANIVTV